MLGPYSAAHRMPDGTRLDIEFVTPRPAYGCRDKVAGGSFRHRVSSGGRRPLLRGTRAGLLLTDPNRQKPGARDRVPKRHPAPNAH